MRPYFAGMWVVFAAVMLIFTGMAERGSAAESECAEGNQWLSCEAKKGDPVAMYAVGRQAYEEGRKSGDFTAALEWARQLVAKKEKNGERLLKMVYLELGWGNHKDFVQAYVWLSEAISHGEDSLVYSRKFLMGKMTPEQIAEAQKRVGG